MWFASSNWIILNSHKFVHRKVIHGRLKDMTSPTHLSFLGRPLKDMMVRSDGLVERTLRWLFQMCQFLDTEPRTPFVWDYGPQNILLNTSTLVHLMLESMRIHALQGIMQTWHVPCAIISSFVCERGFFFLGT